MRDQVRARLDEYEHLLFTQRPEFVARTPEREAWLDRVASNMYECARRSRGRDLEQIRAGVDCMAIEVALAQRLGVPYEMKDDIDPSDQDTFAYDVVYEGEKIETKIHNTRWFSMSDRALNTFRRHCKDINFLVTANILIERDEWIVGFKLVAHAPTFFSFWTQGHYKKKFYDSYDAAPDFCRENKREYFTQQMIEASQAIYNGYEYISQ